MANKAELRQFIMTYFSDDELNALCFDYFPEVLNNFTTGMTKSQKVIELLSYCERRDLMENLHAALAILRSEPYQQLIDSLPTIKPRDRVEGRDPNRIFLSHANQDAGFAQQLADDLRRHDYDVWIAPHSIEPGEKWVDAIERGLETSGIFLLVMTANAANSRWVKDESSYAIDLANKGEIRLLTLDVGEGKMPPMWRVRQHIPFRQDYDDGLRQLLAALRTKKPVAAVLPTTDTSPPSSRIPAWASILVGLVFVLLAVVLTRSLLLSAKDEEPPPAGTAVAGLEPATTHPTTFVTVIHTPTPRPEAPASVTPQPTVTPSPTIEPTRIAPTTTNPAPIVVTVIVTGAPPPQNPTSSIPTDTPPTNTPTPEIATPTVTDVPTDTPTMTISGGNLEEGPVFQYEIYDKITDDDGVISIEVPREWTDGKNGSVWRDENGTIVGSQLVAIPNGPTAIGYRNPFVVIRASQTLAERNEDDLLSEYNYSAVCIFVGRFPYFDGVYSGFYDEYSSCGEQSTSLFILAAKPGDATFAVIVAVHTVTEADDEARQRIWDTFFLTRKPPG